MRLQKVHINIYFFLLFYFDPVKCWTSGETESQKLEQADLSTGVKIEREVKGKANSYFSLNSVEANSQF